MDEMMRVKIGAGAKALDFVNANPSGVPRFEDWKGKLSAEVEKARMYAQVFGEGRDASRSATALKEEDRDAVLDDIRALVRVGRAASEEVKEAKTYWRVGTAQQAEEDLLARGRRYVAKARTHEAVFAGFGLTPVVLDAMTTRLDALEAHINSQAQARATHVGARVELAGIARRMMRALEALAAIYEQDFAENAEKLAAWRSASNIAWPDTKAARAARRARQKGDSATA